MRTDEEEESSKCYFRNSFCPICPICPPYFLSVLKIRVPNGQKRTQNMIPPPPPPFTRKLKDLLYYRLWNLVGKGNKVVYIT